MSGRGDLTNLFAAPGGAEPFRQGEILSFSPATGANSVRVGGAVLTDLPVLVGGDTVNFSAGDAVVLLKLRGSWAILGRIVVPGNEDLTSAAVDFYAGGGVASAFNVTGVSTTQGSVSIPTPEWANSAVFFATARVIAANSSGSADSLRVLVDINAQNGPESIHQFASDGNFYTVCASVARHLGPGGFNVLTSSTLVEVKVRKNGAAGSWAGGGISSAVDVIGIFRRV